MKQFFIFLASFLFCIINLFSQNANPYSIFGYESKIEYKLPMDKLFRINNTDTASPIKAITIDFDNSLLYFLAEYDVILDTMTVNSEDILIWLSVDPLAHKYPHLSPYVYCANNPLKFIDPDGRTIVDADGNTVYTHENGWAKGVDKGTRRIGEAMMQTETGREQFNKMVDSKSQIQLVLSSENRGSVMGLFEPGKANMDANGNIDLQSGTITIYEGSVTSYLNGSAQRNVYNPQNVMDIFSMGTTLDEQIGAVAGHESVHATCPQNLKMNYQSTPSRPHPELETKPNQVKMNILQDIFINKIRK